MKSATQTATTIGFLTLTVSHVGKMKAKYRSREIMGAAKSNRPNRVIA